MEKLCKILIDKWKDIIESININGYTRKVQYIDFFRMERYYYRYPNIEYCYKVNFWFSEALSNMPELKYPDLSSRHEIWEEKLKEVFINLFDEYLYSEDGENFGETVFENSKIDYMTYQGHRFIIQFYPQGFISDQRNEKIDNLLL